MSERPPMQDTLGSDGTYQATLTGVEPAKSESGPRYQDEQWLREQYVEKGLTTYEIAEKCECSHSTVARWLRNHGIETREPSSVMDERLKDEQWLREQYVEKELTIHEIAEKCECSDVTANRWLRKHGIETRTVEIDERLKDEQWLREQYVEKELTIHEIAEKCECSPHTIHRRLRENDIKTRQPPTELQGEKHPSWNGGAAPYGPGWDESKRQHVRERDNYTCQAPDCDTTQSEHRERRGQKLHVHHLRKARDIDDPEERNAAANLVTLCRECHRRWEKVADAGLVPQFSTVADD